jgi:hypothetical protein
MLAPALLAAALSLALQPTEVITELRVHGNAVTPDDEVLRLAAVQVGAPLDEGTIAAVEGRLRASERFRRVEVLKRFASIADPSQVILVIMVDDGPVKIEWDRDSGRPPRTVRRRGPQVMFLPVLDAEDGYGFTYGMRFALPDVAGPRSRLAVPLTWGGDKRAAAQFEKAFARGPIDRVTTGVSISRRENPFFAEDDDRTRVWIRGERNLLDDVRAGATVAREHVSFIGEENRFVQAGGDVVLDTRLDPTLARNAIYARAGWDHVAFREGEPVSRTQLEARGYLGLVGQSVLVVRALHEAADGPLPPYLQPLLGGLANLRGFKAGTAAGDHLAAGSLELRVPLTSPLSVGKVGVSAFADAAAVYDHGERLADQPFRYGVGGGVWFSAAFLHLNLAIARGIGQSTRAHFGTSVTF